MKPDGPTSPERVPNGGVDAHRLLVMAESLAHMGHWRFDALTREVFWSDEAKRIHGLPLDFQPTVDAAFDSYEPGERERVRAILAQALIDGEYPAFESRITRADGSKRELSSSGIVERDANGEICGLVGIYQDVTERKDAERERDRVLERMTLATRAGKIGIWDQDMAAQTLVWDANMFPLYGVEPHETDVRDAFWKAVHPQDVERVRAEVDAARRVTSTIDTEFRIVRPDGEVRVLHLLGTVVFDAAGSAVRMVGASWDITEIRTLAEQLRCEKDALLNSEARYRALTEAIPQLVSVIDSTGRFEYVNARWTEYTGLSLEESRSGDARSRTLHPDDLAIIERLRRNVPPVEFECEVRLRRRDGTYRSHVFRSVPFADHGGTGKWVSSATDIEDRKHAEARIARAAAELAHLAHHDALTDLPNRKLLIDRLTQATAQASRSGTGVTVLYLDLDRFKLINDGLGHAAGDRVLAETGTRIAKALRTGDTASRVGGDEFVLVCASREGDEDATSLAARLLATVGAPIDVGGTFVTVGASIGISHFPADDGDPDALIRKADAAMYAAKQSGRNAFRVYTADMNVALAQTVQLEAQLRTAIAERQFVVYYQPIISLVTGRIIGAEALVRWQHPQRGLLQPGAFVPFAEEHGYIAQIGDLVLHEVCAYVTRLGIEPHTEFSLAVNVSAQQFQRPDFVSGLAAALARYGVDVKRIEVEITESTVMGNTAATVAVLRELRELGVKLSLDDFGTGYSSLAYIKNFPIDTLKIDRSFVRDIATDRTDQALAKTIITLAHSLGMRVVGEGAETHAQLEMLRRFGVDCCQGYLISHPLAPDEFARFRHSYAPFVPSRAG